MNVRERVEAVMEGDMPDRIPQLIYSNFLPRGSFERKLRNMEIGLDVRCAVHTSESPNVERRSRTEGEYRITDIITPVGTLREKRRMNLTFQNPGGSWRVEHPVKGVEDLEVLNYIFEDTTYQPDYDNYTRLKSELEGDGVVTVGTTYSPLMNLIVHQLGYRTFSVMLKRHPEALEESIDIVDKSFTEIFRIAGESPAPSSICRPRPATTCSISSSRSSTPASSAATSSGEGSSKLSSLGSFIPIVSTNPASSRLPCLRSRRSTYWSA